MNAHALAARFDPISLEEVDRRAPLQTRTDSKYVVDASTVGRLVAALEPEYLVLDVGGTRVARYDSVYFDTPDLLSYRQHRQGRRRRFKSRTRLYGTGGACFFEVKLKNGRNETVKRRIAIPADEHGSLGPAAAAFLQALLERAYGTTAPSALAATLRTSYARITLVNRRSSERVTCDFSLGFETADGELQTRHDRVLVETKSARGNGHADRVLRRLGQRPVTGCSKYCLGVALAHPDLGGSAFRRLLRLHFDPSRLEPLAA